MSASTERKNRQAAREAGTDKKTLAAQEEAKRKQASKRKWTLGTILVVLLVACILVLNSGLLYTHTTAVTIGDTRYSPAEVNYHYSEQYQNFVNQYGSYASLFGLDTSAGITGLASQECPMLENGTWKDYFLDYALSEMVQTKALMDYARDNGLSLTEEEIAAVDSQFEGLDDYAKGLGYSGANAMLSAYYGTGVTLKLARQALLDSSLASKSYSHKQDSLSYSAEDLETYYQSLNGSSDLFAYVFHHIDAETVETTAEDGTVSSAPTEETMAAAHSTAQAIADAYQKAEGEGAERLQSATDELLPGQTVTERKNVSGGSLPAAYAEWLLDGARKSGDVTVADDDSGSAVVVFLSREDNHYKVAQVRHILVKAVADENGVYTDEAKAAAKAKAEELLAQWKAGDKTEESFAELATAESEDTGSASNGGLYDQVRKGQMVPEFEAFCFGGHKPGDTAIVYGESDSYAGYHVMYYVGEGEQYSDIIARNDMVSLDMEAWLSELTAGLEAVHGFGYKLIGK